MTEGNLKKRETLKYEMKYAKNAFLYLVLSSVTALSKTFSSFRADQQSQSSFLLLVKKNKNCVN